MARHATTQLQRPEDNVQELLSRTWMEEELEIQNNKKQATQWPTKKN